MQNTVAQLTDTASIPKLASVEQLARAWDISPTTLRRWARENNLHAVKIGREWRFRIADLVALVEKSR